MPECVTHYACFPLPNNFYLNWSIDFWNIDLLIYCISKKYIWKIYHLPAGVGLDSWGGRSAQSRIYINNAEQLPQNANSVTLYFNTLGCISLGSVWKINFFPTDAPYLMWQGLIFVFFKRISQFLRGWAESGVDWEASKCHQTHAQWNAEDCCGFHVIRSIMSALSYNITKLDIFS